MYHYTVTIRTKKCQYLLVEDVEASSKTEALRKVNSVSNGMVKRNLAMSGRDINVNRHSGVQTMSYEQQTEHAIRLCRR